MSEEGPSAGEYQGPLMVLAQNCAVMHNLLGPACIFLRKGFAENRQPDRELRPEEIEVGGHVDFDDFVELMGPKLLAETADMIGDDVPLKGGLGLKWAQPLRIVEEGLKWSVSPRCSYAKVRHPGCALDRVPTLTCLFDPSGPAAPSPLHTVKDSCLLKLEGLLGEAKHGKAALQGQLQSACN
ncbi:hypothetical protein JD844_015002 [Phrynosoma platyrhinos]|uniref:Uncharacterized protein n=1 Tax=Phrynosoma platyrhinos TaxID=52577 RepID=A0ABQ7T7Q2_PHRPL|nr:hypothetical protein JD844_015002 [Phrynosoma platyrhinos]